MSEKNSIAARKRWAKMPKEKRKKHMSDLAKKRHALMTPEEKRRYALKLVKARERKRKGLSTV